MHDARIELLQRMAIFGGVRLDILQFLVALCPVVAVSRNEYFFHEGDEGDTLFVLESGEAAVLKSWRGQDHLIHTLSAGDCFGEMAVMDHCRRSASIRAVDDCSAIPISSGDLYRVYGQDLKQFTLIQMNMGREVSRRLRAANDQLFKVHVNSPDPIVEQLFSA
ncbi:MAG: cyclic nucleotide-binding domain-containing protein [Hyphomicrobium sp.]|jgi:CRP-like cAMP-binding protein|nr:cyclic nucleotide-binding domain-containing protein [Hyphomicrobium sp.]